MLTYPDHGAYQSSVITPEGDIGEIIARLGGPRYRRQGRILSFCDFSPNTDGWILDHDSYRRYSITPTGAGSASGVACADLLNYGASTAALQKYIPISENRRIGFEFMIEWDYSNSYTIFEVAFWEGTAARIARMRIYANSGDTYYQNDTGYHLFGTIAPLSVLRNWVNIKLVADNDQDKYVRMYVNNQEYNMDFALRHEATVTEYGTFFAIYGYSIDGIGWFKFSIDNILITTNEH